MRRLTAAFAVAAGGLAACGGASQAAACGPVEHPELQGGAHLIGDTAPPVPYSSTPGTSGFHTAGRPRTGVVGEPLTEPEIVTLLEGGQAVAAYDPEQLPPSEVRDLRDLARGRLAGRLTVTPFNRDMGAPLTLNAWGTRQACGRVDAAAVAAFVARHGGDEAEERTPTPERGGRPPAPAQP